MSDPTHSDDGRPIVFWTTSNDVEQLHYETIGEALDAYVTALEELGDGIPATVTVYGYARMKPTCFAGDVLEWVLDGWEEELGDPDGGYDPITPEMRAICERFERDMIAAYEPWACECVKTMEIPIR